MSGILLSVVVPTSAVCKPPQGPFDHEYAEFDDILQKHVVKEGAVSGVNYLALSKEQQALKLAASRFSRVTREEYLMFSKDERLAFLINAYNLFTLILIAEEYPIESIQKIDRGGASPWKIEFIELLGEQRSLDEVEHKLIRAQFREPRIHFAVNCAAKGCPALQAEPFRASVLDSQLQRAALEFMQDQSRNYYNASSRILYLSQLFQWYEKDFEQASGSVQAFVAPFMGAGIEQQVRLGEQIEYLPYDWSLNEVIIP